MPKKSILILEDEEKRIADFRMAIARLGVDFQARIWRDAPTMISELLISFATHDCFRWTMI